MNRNVRIVEMKYDYEVGQLPDVCYVGLHADELPFEGVLKKRLKAVAYEGGDFEIFYYVVTLFEEHEFRWSKDFKIAKWIAELKDKLTQLITFKNSYVEKIRVFNQESRKSKSSSGDNKFYFSDNYSIFLSEAETIILKVSSILDIAVQLFSRMSGSYVDSFGQWISTNAGGNFTNDVDKKMQELCLALPTLMLNHKINNKIKHHESLKLYPFSAAEGWSVCLTGTACESKLLLLDKYVEATTQELTKFLVAMNERIRERF